MMKTQEKKEKLVNRFMFRMTDHENQLLKDAADKLGCRPSDAARLAVTALAIAAGTTTAKS